MGAHCVECIRAARPPTRQRVRRWNATAGPLATKVLIAVNVAVFVATSVGGVQAAGRGGDLQSQLSLYGPAVAAGQWYRLVSSGFVHYGLLHIGFNMLLLYQLGLLLEPALGRFRFLALYFAALLGGSFGALLLSPTVLSAGASGAVFGLFGAAAAGLRQRGVKVMQTNIGVLLVINLVLTFAVPGISIGAHVGGLVAGTLVGWVMLHPTRRSTVTGIAMAVVVMATAVAGSLWAAGR
ncbi:MAG: rhomboid family intramembrane serine protease [Acidimicrobiia bacterium]|nr:rhomboid family intramembrane serine protease [Acidimicrobiia bacterium]